MSPIEDERRIVRASASSLDPGDVHLPSIYVSPTSEAESTLRGRGIIKSESIEMTSTSGIDSSFATTEHLLSEPGLGPPRSSPSPSRGTSILRRLGSLRSPVKTLSMRSPTTKDRGRHYDAIGEEEVDEEQYGIDLSTLGGMGYMLEDVSSSSLVDPNSNMIANPATGKDLHGPACSFAPQLMEGRLGKGMIIAAQYQIKRNPSSPGIQDTSSSTLAPEAASPANFARAKSVRDIGQHLAQKRQVMVEVNEAFDLGSLEGAELDRQGRKRASHQSFDTMNPTKQSSAIGLKSYFFPEDPDHPNWKPFSMRSYYILMLTSVSLGLGIFQEWLCRHSEALAEDGLGILQFDHVSSVPLVYFVAWKYLPTLIFVGYGVLWSIMDFDIKRLEPYYQLSRPVGSPAAASLNLDHLTAWSYFVPFTAGKLQQWAVFFSSLGNILATSIAPSLQNPSINLYQNQDPDCSLQTSTCPNGKPFYFVRVSPGWSRALTSSLVVTAAFGVFLFFQLRYVIHAICQNPANHPTSFSI